MNDEILDEYARFLNDIGNNSDFELGKYLEVDYYEDEYSHDEINEAMVILRDKIIGYIHANYPNKFVVFSSYDYCVFVCAIKKAKELRWNEDNINCNIIK